MSKDSLNHTHKPSRALTTGVTICLLFALLPMRAYAIFVPTNDFAINVQKYIDLGKVFGLDGLARLAAQTALSQIESSMINWIKGGGPGGGAMYITDLSGFLYDLNKNAALQQTASLRGANTCYTPGGGTAAPWVNPDTGLVVSGGGAAQPWINPDTGLPQSSSGGTNDIVAASIDNAYARAGQENVTCPFSNGQGFRSVAQDGWGGYVAATTNPGANPFAGDIDRVAKITDAQQRAEKIALAKAAANRMYLDAETCDPNTGKCTVKTPGSTLETQTNFALGSGIRSWENVSKINELITAVMNAAIEKVFSSAEGLFNDKVLAPLSNSINNVISNNVPGVSQTTLQNSLKTLQQGIKTSVTAAANSSTSTAPFP